MMDNEINLNEKLFSGCSGAVLAVSGGPDSMAMLDLFRKSDFNIPYVCATFNHGLRKEADDEVDGVQTYCRDFSINFETEKENIMDSMPSGISIEEHARNKRYAFLEKIKQKYGYSHIVTAHNSDDNAESFLMNLTRGCGIDGLCGIHEIRFDNNTIRPLLKYSKQELLDYCHINGVPYWIDQSNFDTDFRRNYFRHKIIPLFKEINPMFVSSLYETSSFIATDCDFLNKESLKVFNKAYIDNGLSLDALKDIHPSILSRVLRLYLRKEINKTPSRNDTNTILNLFQTGNTSDECALYGVTFRLTYTQLTTNPILNKEGFDNICLKEDITVLPYGCIKILRCNNYRGEYNCIKKCDMSNAIVRSRKSGDYMHTPQGSGKSLKKLYTDKKIPVDLRPTLPLITLNDEIIWAYKIGTNHSYLPNIGEDYFKIEYDEKKEND